MRNFCVSSRAISLACAVDECVDVSSACCDWRVERWRESFFREDSASRRRRSRACCRVESDSETRATASLSGAMLKLEIV